MSVKQEKKLTIFGKGTASNALLSVRNPDRKKKSMIEFTRMATSGERKNIDVGEMENEILE